MDVIILPRGAGKTQQLLDILKTDSRAVIVCANYVQVKHLRTRAQLMGISAGPQSRIIHVQRLKDAAGYYSRDNIYLDNGEHVVGALLGGLNVVAMTITGPEVPTPLTATQTIGKTVGRTLASIKNRLAA